MEVIVSRASVVNLRCEYMKAPLGIDIERPRLSWEIISPERGTMQMAYQVVVAESEKNLEQGDMLWDSGRVSSDKSICCEYAGPALESRKQYYWKVRIWDEQGRLSSFSCPSFFEMGLLRREDWKASWIEICNKEVTMENTPMGNGQQSGGENNQTMSLLSATNEGIAPPEQRLNPCRLVRRQFSVKNGIRRARIYATAHGIYSLEVNGSRTDCREFAPENTSYDKYLLYQTYDVTELLRTGENVVGAVVADGWFAGRVGFMGDSCQYGNKLALLLQLEIEYEDGTIQRICSDESFSCADGPFVYSDIFIGERYDARLEKQNWSCSGYMDIGWEPARKVDYGFDNLQAQYGEPVCVVEELVPVKVLVTPEGDTVIDLGQNIAGRMRMKVCGQAGTLVRLEHTEVLDRQGNFINNIMGRNKDQTDVYILSGKGVEVYEPCFTFHGFRYVRITGYPGEVKVENFRGVVLSSGMERTGHFECSDERFNRLARNIFWSQRANMFSIPTDCPQRERAGWTGDIQVFSPTACFNMNVHAFLTRWLKNVWADQLPDGKVPMVVPYMDAYRALAKVVGSDTSAGWGDACVIVPWTLYQVYGDKRILEQSYDSMVKWVEYIRKTAETEIPEDLKGEMTPERRERQKYLWNTGFHYGDWLIPSLSMSLDGKEVDMFKSALETKALVPSCFYAYATELMVKIATLLHKTEDAQFYASLNEKVRTAFALEYLNEDGSMAADFQGIYVLALRMKMVPEKMRSKVFARLLKLIEQNGGKLDVGFLSVPFLLDVLCDFGRLDLAMDMLHRNECPSWLYEVEKGATTMWEAWQAILPDGTVTNVSYNHYAFGCIGDWIYRKLAGLDKDAPAYKHILIKPQPDHRMTHASASYHSIYGEIISDWRALSRNFYLKVKIPPNTTATVHLPGVGPASIIDCSGIRKSIASCRDISGIRKENGKTVFEIKSGSYEFKIQLEERL